MVWATSTWIDCYPTAPRACPSTRAGERRNRAAVSRDIVLRWTAGVFAATHDVYFGAVFEDVNDASRANPVGVLVSRGQTAAAYDPPGVLDFGTTYYWRVDEVNAAPDSTIYRGQVWSFTTEPFAYPIEGVIATSNGISEE